VIGLVLLRERPRPPVVARFADYVTDRFRGEGQEGQ
jgi:hypothetical protein